VSNAAPKLPLPIRLVNGGFAALGPLGKRVLGLNPDALMAQAVKSSGLSDFGDDYFRGPLQRFCDSLEQDAKLTGLGRIIAKKEILRLLGNRLQLEDRFTRHPEIADEQIIAPIFILGMPRTGTTSLHELMALDPQFRVPLSWELAHPFPPPETATYKTDPRIEKVTKELAQIDKLLPEFRNMHPMGAELPQECVSLFNHDFASMIFDVQFRVKDYQRWLIQEDMTAVFANHRRWLQLLQWRCPGQTWVLKSPQYLWNIDDMLKQYPDARVVQNHRDPVKVAMSIGSLVTTLRGLGSNELDLKETTQDYADLLHYGTGKTMAARASGQLNTQRVIDVQFAEFRKDPVAAVASVYQHFGLTFEPQVSSSMQAFLDKGTNTERHGKHVYDLAGSGLNLERERRRFADYQRAYGIPSENIE
jgi:hypothetical protein